jgi:hypothetical protein
MQLSLQLSTQRHSHIVAYASRTGTRTTLAALRGAGWRLLVSATGVWRTEGFPYALDNGAWTSFQQGRPFDEGLFTGLVAQLGAGADWVVAPDIVAGGLKSLAYTEAWLPRLTQYHALVAVQDGMEEADVRPLLSPGRVGLFVGGSTEWKVATIPQWGRLAREAGCYLHVGRVNTAKRMRLCMVSGANSFDGTSVTKFPKTLGLLERTRREECLVRMY